jgi:hypothetical protein
VDFVSLKEFWCFSYVTKQAARTPYKVAFWVIEFKNERLAVVYLFKHCLFKFTVHRVSMMHVGFLCSRVTSLQTFSKL